MPLTPEDERRLMEAAPELLAQREAFDGLLARASELTGTGIDQISALTIAGDERSAAWLDSRVEKGEDALQMAHLCGSYSTMNFALKHLEAGHIDKAALLRELPELWRGSDPDDTDPRFLALWKDARAAKKGYIRDGHALPPGNRVTVFRGQRRFDPFGIAWTTDIGVAKQFALTFGLRGGPQEGGVVFMANAPRSAIIAYLTGRGESEVIVDPADLRTIVPWLSATVKPKEGDGSEP